MINESLGHAKNALRRSEEQKYKATSIANELIEYLKSEGSISKNHNPDATNREFNDLVDEIVKNSAFSYEHAYIIAQNLGWIKSS